VVVFVVGVGCLFWFSRYFLYDHQCFTSCYVLKWGRYFMNMLWDFRFSRQRV
jgi:hypothetical protein